MKKPKKMPKVPKDVLKAAYIAGACARYQHTHGKRWVEMNCTNGFTHYGAAEAKGVEAVFQKAWEVFSSK